MALRFTCSFRSSCLLKGNDCVFWKQSGKKKKVWVNQKTLHFMAGSNMFLKLFLRPEIPPLEILLTFCTILPCCTIYSTSSAKFYWYLRIFILSRCLWNICEALQQEKKVSLPSFDVNANKKLCVPSILFLHAVLSISVCFSSIFIYLPEHTL